jgi:hypothetical protein
MTTSKIILYLSVLLGFIPLPLICQDGFKKVINYDDSKSLNFDDIQFQNDKIYISGNAFIDSVKLWGQSIAAFDTTGVLLWEKTYLDTISNIVSNTPSKFFISNNGDFIIPCNFFERGNLGIRVIDSVGKEIFTSEYINSEFTIYPQDVIELHNDIYAFGTIQRTNYLDDIYIIKTDLSGKFKWIKYYGAIPYNEIFHDLIVNPNETFTISSDKFPVEYEIEPFGSHGWKKPWIFTVDTSGNISNEWLGVENDPKTLGGGPFYHMTNGDWIFISREFKEVVLNGSQFTASTPTITKLNSAFGLDWKLYLADYTSFWDQLLDLEFDSIRNEFVTVGQRMVRYNQDYSELEVWVVKFSPEGDILWNISDTIWSDRNNGVKHYTAGVDISPSGSIYVAGTVEHGKNPARSFGWILKMTPDGCYDTLCITTSMKNETKNNDEFIIYPNPTEGSITISAPKEFTGGLIAFYDIYGRLMKKIKIDDIHLNIDFDFLPGLYFYSIYKANRLELTGKLIKN